MPLDRLQLKVYAFSGKFNVCSKRVLSSWIKICRDFMLQTQIFTQKYRSWLRFLLRNTGVDSDFTQNFWGKYWRLGALVPRYKTGCQDDLFQGILGLLSALHMNTSGRQFFQVDLTTHFLLKQVQLDDDFQPWQWETLRELQSNRFLYSRSVTTLSATWWTLVCFSKDTLKENKKPNPVRNWGGPRENISRRRGWSDKSRRSPKALEVWKKLTQNRRRRRRNSP